MSRSCKMPIDYNRRVLNVNSGIVHAYSCKAEQTYSFTTACGNYLLSGDGCKNTDRPINCKSCLKVIGANDADEVIYNGTLYAIVTNDGLFVDRTGSLTANILKAATYRQREKAVDATKAPHYVDQKDSSIALLYHEYRDQINSLEGHRARQVFRERFITQRRPLKGQTVVPITLSYNGGK